MLEQVKARLVALEIPFDNQPSSHDESLMIFSIEKVEFYIQARTNLKLIPAELTKVFIDMVVGDFLSTKHSMGKLDLTTFNFEPVLKQITDGDTTTIFAANEKVTPEVLFNNLVETMRHGNVRWSDYRVIKW